MDDEYSTSSSSTSSSDTDFEMFLEIADIENVGMIRRPKVFQERKQPFYFYSEVEFRCRYRFSKRVFTYILNIFQDELTARDDRGDPVSAENKLLITLRYYATANVQLVLTDFTGIDQATMCRIINKTTLCIAKKFHQFVKTPSAIQQEITARRFYQMHGIPRVCGLIDCTHIPIQSPGGDNGELFRNKKGWFSINCQIVCDHKLRIFDLVARWHGSTYDQTILNFSLLKSKLERGDFGNYFLLGDNGFANKRYLLTPISNAETVEEKKYNEIHKLTRKLVATCISIWKKRFPIIAVKSRQRVQNSLKVIVATVVLHNIAMDQGEPEPPEPEIVLPRQFMRPVPSVRNVYEASSDVTVRNEIVGNLFQI